MISETFAGKLQRIETNIEFIQWWIIFLNLVLELRHSCYRSFSTQYPIQGIQFHPESFATEGGKELMENFLLGS